MQGPRIMSWHQIDDNNPAETKATLFGMTISAKMNMAEGPLVVKSETELVVEEVEQYIQKLDTNAFKAFVQQCNLKK